MKDEGNAGAALGPVKPMQEDMFGQSLEEARFRAEGGATKKRGKHFGSDHGNSRTGTEEKKI